MNLFLIGILLLVVPTLCAFGAIRVFASDNWFWQLCLRVCQAAPFLWGIGVACLVIAGTHWFDTHSIHIAVK